MNIFITGGTGFIGSNFLIILTKKILKNICNYNKKNPLQKN